MNKNLLHFTNFQFITMIYIFHKLVIKYKVKFNIDSLNLPFFHRKNYVTIEEIELLYLIYKSFNSDCKHINQFRNYLKIMIKRV